MIIHLKTALPKKIGREVSFDFKISVIDEIIARMMRAPPFRATAAWMARAACSPARTPISERSGEMTTWRLPVVNSCIGKVVGSEGFEPPTNSV